MLHAERPITLLDRTRELQRELSPDRRPASRWFSVNSPSVVPLLRPRHAAKAPPSSGALPSLISAAERTCAGESITGLPSRGATDCCSSAPSVLPAWRSEKPCRQATHPVDLRYPRASFWGQDLDKSSDLAFLGRTPLHQPHVCTAPRLTVLLQTPNTSTMVVAGLVNSGLCGGSAPHESSFVSPLNGGEQ